MQLVIAILVYIFFGSLISFIIFLTTSSFIKKERFDHPSCIAVLMTYYCIMIVWGMDVSFRVYRYGGTMLTFFIIIVCFAGFTVVRPSTALIGYGIAFTSFYVVIYMYDKAQYLNVMNYSAFGLIIILIAIKEYLIAKDQYTQKFRGIELTEELRKQSLHDELTGLLNRHALEDRLALTEKKSFHIAMSDIDYFKSYNDNYGHLVGDAVLKNVSKAMHAFFFDQNCYRYGGDEFLIIAEGIDDETFDKLLDMWKKRVGTLKVDGVDHPITVSVGQTSGDAANSEELIALIREADSRLYDIKKARTPISR